RPMRLRARREGCSPVASSPTKVTLPFSIGTKPVMALKRVVLPAPFGPISPRISEGLSARDTRSTASTPPKRTVMSSALSASGIAPPNEPAVHLAHDAAGKKGEHQKTEHPLHEQVDLGEGGAEDLARADEQHGTDERTPDRATTADDGGERDLHGKEQEEEDVGLQERQHHAVDASANRR